MSRLLRIALALLAPTIFVIVFALATYQPQPSGPAESVLYSYLGYRNSTTQQLAPIQQMVEATRPGNFTPEMSKATFGSGPYYRTTFSDRPIGDQGSRAIPYPPVEVWCVLLRQSDSTLPRVVFYAQHQDMYNADWIVHEPAAETLPELQASLAAVGCKLILQP